MGKYGGGPPLGGGRVLLDPNSEFVNSNDLLMSLKKEGVNVKRGFYNSLFCQFYDIFLVISV